MTLITLLLIAILVALLVQIADGRKRERYARQREEHHREEQGRQEQEEDTKPRRRVAVQVFVMGDELRALDAEGRQWTWHDDRWWALSHLMLPQVEDDRAFELFSLKHDDRLREFLPEAKARYDAARRASSFPGGRAAEEVKIAIGEFVASLEEPEELREALEREVERNFYIYLKREENEGRS